MRKIKPKSNKSMTDTPALSTKGEEIWPTFRIGLEHLPEAKKWKIGEEYTIELKVKMVGISQSRFQNDAEFEIKEIESESASDEKEEDSEESE